MSLISKHLHAWPWSLRTEIYGTHWRYHYMSVVFHGNIYVNINISQHSKVDSITILWVPLKRGQQKCSTWQDDKFYNLLLSTNCRVQYFSIFMWQVFSCFNTSFLTIFNTGLYHYGLLSSQCYNHLNNEQPFHIYSHCVLYKKMTRWRDFQLQSF